MTWSDVRETFATIFVVSLVIVGLLVAASLAYTLFVAVTAYLIELWGGD